MHQFHVTRALADQRRQQLGADADAHRRIGEARAAAADAGIETVQHTIWTARIPLGVRPIAPNDADRLTRLFARLSPRSVRFRYFAPIRRLPRAELARLVDADHLRQEALVALSNDEIVAVAQYAAEPADSGRADVAVTVEDTWQGRGVGTRLARHLSALAVARGLDTFVATILAENRPALRLVRSIAPEASIRWARGEYEATIPLARSR